MYKTTAYRKPSYLNTNDTSHVPIAKVPYCNRTAHCDFKEYFRAASSKNIKLNYLIDGLLAYWQINS